LRAHDRDVLGAQPARVDAEARARHVEDLHPGRRQPQRAVQRPIDRHRVVLEDHTRPSLERRHLGGAFSAAQVHLLEVGAAPAVRRDGGPQQLRPRQAQLRAVARDPSRVLRRDRHEDRE